jgi:hypothetical protein
MTTSADPGRQVPGSARFAERKKKDDHDEW